MFTVAKRNRNWLEEHQRDLYVRASKRDGYRSRAAYKLIQLNDRDRFMRARQVVVDLGAAPGGWSQVAAETVGDAGRVIALDILPMEPLTGVTFIQEDFRDESALTRLTRTLEGRAADLVISDMAPNMSGIRVVDQTAGVYICELCVQFAVDHLAAGGAMVMKLFQGEGIDALQRDIRRRFKRVLVRKPDASRSKSREMYLVAMDYLAEN